MKEPQQRSMSMGTRKLEEEPRERRTTSKSKHFTYFKGLRYFQISKVLKYLNRVGNVGFMRHLGKLGTWGGVSEIKLGKMLLIIFIFCKFV